MMEMENGGNLMIFPITNMSMNKKEQKFKIIYLSKREESFYLNYYPFRADTT